MKKLLLAGLPVLIIFMGLPFLVTLMVVMTTSAAAECRTQSSQGTAPTELGDLGAIDGPVGGPVNGKITFAQANIPRRSGLDGFRASMPKVLSKNPEFVTLNEASGWSLEQIEAAAPGYSAFRVAAPAGTGTGAEQAMGNVVLWKSSTWTKVNGGRVQLVDDDKTFYDGRPVTWDRFATWVMLRRADGSVVSVVSTHHMTNPHRWPKQHGNPPLTRPQQYGAGMDILLQLRNSLAAHGPVLIGGDMNTQASYTDIPWTAAAKMKAAGYGWHNHGVDFIFFPHHQGARLEQGWDGTMVSDHHWLSARIAMNGAGPETAPKTITTTGGTVPAAHTARKAEPPAGDVLAQLMRLRFASNYPTLTAEQARNAITIAQVARDLEIPRYGLQIAIATAIQESKLVNLTGGDRDSGGLFQQRPSAGWGSRAEITSPVLAARAFFGQAQHTGNPGLLDIPGWQNMPLTQAAQAVQISGYPDAYAQWEDVAGDITSLLGGDLPDLPDAGANGSTTNAANCQGETVNPITVGTLNLLGAGHTDSPGERPGYDTWDKRLPGAMRTIENAGVSIAGLQEVHGPQAKALETQYAAKWGIYPASGKAQNRVIWDRNEWNQTDARLVDIPYFGGKDVGMPLVQLTSTTTGQVIWVWSIHNPANVNGNAAVHRKEGLRRQLATMTDLAGTGTPAVILGDFNDGKDGSNASHCALTPELSNAFGGSAEPCKKPKKDAPIDHIYGTNLTWASAEVDNSTQASKIADHPLVTATTAGSSAGCAVGSGTAEAKYNLGPVKPQLTQLVNILGHMFDIKTIGGYRESATDPNGHPAGLAADFMVPLNAAGRAQGDRLASYAKANAQKLGIDYIIWYQRIWSVARAGEGWRPMEDRGSATENHLDHVHINVKPGAPGHLVQPVGLEGASCDEVVYPVPAQYVGTDNHNWHETGPYWSKWHTGTDFSAPCGTTVYAAHAGTIEIDTTQRSWAGPQLVKVTTGAGSLTTWYAHMQTVTVSRGQTVAAGEPIGQVGKEGNVSGCHLHFEVHLKNGSIYGPDNVDPSTWLAENASPPSRPI